jgi:hypothetical protein
MLYTILFPYFHSLFLSLRILDYLVENFLQYYLSPSMLLFKAYYIPFCNVYLSIMSAL